MDKDIKRGIRYVKGVGEKRAQLFSRLGIHSIEDILYYFPRRYEDRTHITEIARLKVGQWQTVKAKILGFGERSSYRRWAFKIFEVIVDDDTGRLLCVWFNQPYLKEYLSVGRQVVLYGKVDVYGSNVQMQNPEYEIVDGQDEGNSLNYGRIVPVYSVGEKLSQRMFRRMVKGCLDEYLPAFIDVLPYDIRERHHLLNTASSILNMHFPKDIHSQEMAYRRILFEECFLLQILFGLKRKKADTITGISHRLTDTIITEFEKSLPFELTCSQRKVIEEIKADMASFRQMHRLLQGDVGSGKTIVAIYGCIIAIANGYQAACMVPTEILAQQHYQNVARYVSGIIVHGRKIRAALLTSSVKAKEKEKLYQEVKEGKIDLLIGTHALIQGGLEFKALSLVVIDEQHKFGVHQRVSMMAKGTNPDCLIMTATPIPRTLAMTLYSDLDVSTITELPKGRIPIRTYLVDEGKRQWVYDFIRENIKSGRQAYIVYPLIEESESLELKSATLMYQNLKNIFKDFKVGLVHGRLRQKERDGLMETFKAGEVNLLVSTIVIEVGIDIPNASVIVIEHAERFGLSQLHQLRGRIGRGAYESHCILVSDSSTQESMFRLQVMVDEHDGFKIAERDLEMRGPGEFFGVRQHGLPELRLNPLENLQLLALAKEEACRLLQKDPLLMLRQNQGLGSALKSRFPDYDKLREA